MDGVADMDGTRGCGIFFETEGRFRNGRILYPLPTMPF